MIAGSLALLAFSASIFAGAWAGNDISTVLLRAWWIMILFLILGTVIGWIAKVAVDEHLQAITKKIMDQLENPEAALPDKTSEVKKVG